jgi:multiple sugar transport system permease protein
MTTDSLSRPGGPATTLSRPTGRAGLYRARRVAGRVAIYALLLIGSVVTLLPFVWLVRSSLMGPAQIFSFPIEWRPDPVRWDNYPEALTAVPFGRYFFNTMRIEFLVLAGTIVTSTISAFAFARLRWRGRNLVFGILLSGLMLPYAATLIPTFILWQQLGGLNTIAPLVVPAWFGGGIFNIFLLRQFFMTIPRDLDEAAYIDGATPLGVLVKIILPLSKPALIVVSIFTFIAVWNDFLGPLIYLGDESQYTLAIGLRSFSSAYTAQWDLLMAASTAVVLPIVVLFFLAQRYFVEGITLTGIKG